ncbi:hypothetical protein GCM10011418_25860 [Sphingobacterium alkalisoli]|nr:hypothetical protein GCM10011418_25860 [Sphingobacterium alkalisoli]
MDYAGGFYGAFGTAVAPGNQWLGKNGKYYNSSWGGNQYTGSRSGAYRAAGMYKWAGRGTVVGGYTGSNVGDRSINYYHGR